MSLPHAFDLERPAVRAGVGLALLLLMAALLVRSSLGKRLVYDEYDNLAYGFRVLTHGPVLPQSGQRMPILVLSALGCPSPCREDEVNATEAGRLLVRLPTIVFTLALGLVLWGWAGEWLGPRPALLALALYALHPTVLAHGKQVTSDVQAAFFTVAALWPVWRIFRRRGDARVNLVLAAAATAGALVSKYTSVLLLPILALAVVGETLRARRENAPRPARILAAAVVFVLLVLLFLNAAYLFDGTLRRTDGYPWRSRALQFLSSVPLPLPLPRAFVRGVDFSFQVQEEPGVGRGYNYVLGQLNTDGVWYAFPLMLLLKTPLAVFALALLAWRWRPPGESGRGGWSWLAAPLAVFLAFFSLLVKPQLGIRYLLPVLPLLILGAARASAAAVTPSRRRLVAILVVWAAVSALSYHPHYMSYFNEPIGPRVNAYRFLADSNLDWEDRTADIARFRAEHPEILLVVEPEAPRAGWILVGANKLVGVYEPERYRWLRENFRPERHVGYSYLLFQVTTERLREISVARFTNQSERRAHGGVEEVSLFVRGLHAARALLSVEAWSGVAPRRVGRPDRACVPVHPLHAPALRAQAARPAVPLGLPRLWRVHRLLRRDARPRGLERVAGRLLARGSGEGGHGGHVRRHGRPARASGARGARPAQPGRAEPGARAARAGPCGAAAGLW